MADQPTKIRDVSWSEMFPWLMLLRSVRIALLARVLVLGALGLLATTLGMIAVLQKIGQPDSQKLIGPAMSVGLIGTLYGISLANLVFMPIAENLTEVYLYGSSGWRAVDKWLAGFFV